MTTLNSYYKSFRLISSIFLYNENKPPLYKIKFLKYTGLNNYETPVKIILPKKITKRVAILYPGASPAAENHPKMDMLGRVLARIGFTVYIPRIPPLKNLNIKVVNVDWFICFYKWIINTKNIDPNNIIMTGISYGGGIMLKSLFELNNKIPLPKTILTYGTYSNSQTMMNFLINGNIDIGNKKIQVTPHEWGLVVIFHNYLKNLQLEWDAKDLLQAIQLRIEDKIEECEIEANKLPKFQKNLFYSIINRDLSSEVIKLTELMIENEQSNMTELSPKIWAHHILNKVFIIHGANDSMVPYTESIQLDKILPNSELFISYLYEHNEISTNRGPIFIMKEIIRFINFYAKLFNHFEN